ncbi:putative transposase for insertion sequence element IS629 [Mycobacterium xenopi 4042]|uniref:Putative transposase for insertion sequence element IS629 n=1 Tax=Mycobacterium xenopi 4042 TaxID=1299334 RepID=X7ZFQ7_MYCXE|nr:putative transposase for insertion sequence element IS629 [Mycobacterium xenopi 4042]
MQRVSSGGARPPTQEIVEFIDANREEFGVEPICTVLRSAGLQVALSTYYDTKARVPSARALRDAVLGPALCQLWKDNYCVYGPASSGKPPAARVMTSAGIRWPG